MTDFGGSDKETMCARCGYVLPTPHEHEHDHDDGGCTCGCPVESCPPCGGFKNNLAPPVIVHTDSVREAWIEYTQNYQLAEAAENDFNHWFESEVERRVADAKAEALKRIAETDAKLADAERTLVELMPDAVLVEGSWIPVAEWPKILGNFMRSTADYARQWKDAEVARADAEKWRHDVANGTGYLIPETGEWANAAMIVEAFNDNLMWARDLPEWQERAEVAEARIAKAVEILSWMPEHDGDDLGRVEDDYRHRAQLADEALTALVAVGQEGENNE